MTTTASPTRSIDEPCTPTVAHAIGIEAALTVSATLKALARFGAPPEPRPPAALRPDLRLGQADLDRREPRLVFGPGV